MIWNAIPEAYLVVENGIETRFTSKAIWIITERETGINKISYYQTKDMEITLDIKVPANVASVYEMVELINF